jgi:hypothetical protein
MLTTNFPAENDGWSAREPSSEQDFLKSST